MKKSLSTGMNKYVNHVKTMQNLHNSTWLNEYQTNKSISAYYLHWVTPNT